MHFASFKWYALIFCMAYVGIPCGWANPKQQKAKYSVFNEVWNAVHASYYDETFGGLDWKKVGNRYEEGLSDIRTASGLRSLLREMLQEIGDSHFSIIEGGYSKRVEPSWDGGDGGMEATLIGQRVFAFRVSPDGASARSGLKAGFEIFEIGDKDLSILTREIAGMGMSDHLKSSFLLNAVERLLYGPPGQAIPILAGPNRKNARKYPIVLESYKGRMSEPFGHLAAMPLEFEARLLQDEIAYCRFNLWFPAIMEDLRTFLGSLNGHARGLILDLRGNRGGIGLMAAGVAGLLSQKPLALGSMNLRSGNVNYIAYPQAGSYSGPVAVLIDSNSLSTSEIFAAGLQEYHRARIFGEPTSGAALPSSFIKLSNGDLLQIPMADFVTSRGRRLEGRGVSPDSPVTLSAAQLLLERDNVIEAARNWLNSRS